MLSFRILGPIEAYRDGERLPLRGRRQLALLAYLLLNADRPVPSDRLVDELWEPSDRLIAAKPLQIAITRLRKALGDEAGPDRALQTTTGGYLLRLGDSELDADRFRKHVERGRSALGEQRFDEAAVVLREADALWRGPALADVAYEQFAQADIVALEELRMAAIEARIEAELGLGRHADLVPELEGFVARNPARERLAEQLMLALYRAGRQTDALDVYQRVRARLADEFGLNPGPGLEARQAEVLGQSNTLTLDRTEARPVVGRGERAPLAAALRAPPATGFVGRRRERTRLEATWRRACGGERCLVLLTGEPGIGKSRLARELAVAAADEGATVLYGRSGEGVGLPYEPWRQALNQLVEAAPESLLRAHVARHGGELVRLVPGLEPRLEGAPGPQSADPQTERYLLFGAVLGLLEAAAHEAPLLVVLEDLHWAARPTLALLMHLQVAAPAMRLLVIGTLREPGAARALTELRGDLRREPGVEWIALQGLCAPEVREIVASTIDQTLDERLGRLVDALHAETDGNPFFVTEIVRHLQESGGLHVDGDGRWFSVEELELPGSVRDVIRGRVARLGEPAVRLLCNAAVIGREFEVDLLAQVARLDVDATLDELERAAAAALVAEHPEGKGQYAFVHALVKHALEDEVGVARGAQLHRRVAEALEQRAADDRDSVVGELAHHWAAAKGEHARERGMHYAGRAGRAALAQLAPEAALTWFRRALTLHDANPADTAERRELLLGLGEAQLHAGHAGFRETLLEAADAARDAGDAERLVRAALANSRGYFSSAGVVDQQRVDVLESALGCTPPEDPCRARLLSLLAAELIWSQGHERRRALSDEAVALARARDDPTTIAHVLAMRVTAVWWPDTLEDRLSTTAELVERCEGLADPVQRFWAHTWQGVTLAQAGDLGGTDRCLEHMSAITGRLQHPRLEFVLATQAGWRAQAAGRLGDAERLAERALEIGTRAGEPDARSLYAAQLAPIRWHQGRLAEVADVMAAIAGTVPGVSGFRALHTLSELEAGRPERAAALLEAEASDAFAGVSHDPVMLGALLLWGEAAARLESRDAARHLLARLEPLREQSVVDSLGFLGVVSRCVGLLATCLGRADLADAGFGHALEQHERLHARSLAARTRLEWGLAIAGRIEREAQPRAREMLASARGAAADLGLAGLEVRCAGGLAALEAGAPLGAA